MRGVPGGGGLPAVCLPGRGVGRYTHRAVIMAQIGLQPVLAGRMLCYPLTPNHARQAGRLSKFWLVGP